MKLFAMHQHNNEWEEMYRGFPVEKLPWESGKPSPLLVRFVQDRTIHGKVLDIGCGAGTHAVWMAEQGLKVFGVDVSATAIMLARALATAHEANVDFRLEDAFHLSYDDATFDSIFDRGTYHHQDQHKAEYVREMARVLKPSGKYLLLAFSPKMHWPKSVSEQEVRRMFGGMFTIDWTGEELHIQPDGREVRLAAYLMTKRHG